MSNDEWWSGWSDGAGREIHVGPLPGRKSIALYVIRGSVLDVLAYFRNEEDAAEAIRWLRWLADARLAPGTHP